jgi:hypothetical protein
MLENMKEILMIVILANIIVIVYNRLKRNVN